MLFSEMGLTPAVQANIAALGWRRPTDIQYKAIPPILEGTDVMAVAQTGTGKTAAFAIPAVCLLERRRRPLGYAGARCVVMEPTHELASQVANVIKQLTSGTGLSVVALYGGVDQENQIALLKGVADIVVATPGRLFDLAAQGHLDVGRAELLAVDEADRMLALGFYHDIRQLVNKLPRRRQTVFFSATINATVKELAYSLVTRAVRIEMTRNRVARNVRHEVVWVSKEEKRFYLERVARENPGSHIMVFVRTQVRAGRVVAAMERVHLTVAGLHGGMDQKARAASLQAFQDGQVQMLISTDVAARGIDLPGVDYVVNYDVPDVAENYVHRVGRTGRGMERGYALTLASEEEKKLVADIEHYLGENLPELQLDNATRAATVELSDDAEDDWRALIRD